MPVLSAFRSVVLRTLVLSLFLAVAAVALAATASAPVTTPTASCLACHSVNQPNLVSSWKKGRHAADGVGCYECHQAADGDPDAMVDHYGFTVSAIVSPKDCARCHPSQAASFLKSHHASAAVLLRDQTGTYKAENGDVQFGGVVQGYASFINGCES
ncbi:MAG TPA: multiheme c-type cytochrome, partial [Candidatus Ozemobacteraceae bacterium]|nr:multiheme c-type cytochrome [Candidatus Ozemobacteraceae bacterium]